MRHPKTFLAILIIIGAIFWIAFWSNIQKVPTEYPQQITNETIETPAQEHPEPLGDGKG